MTLTESTTNSRMLRADPARHLAPKGVELSHDATGPLVAVLAQLVECKLRHSCARVGACVEARR